MASLSDLLIKVGANVDEYMSAMDTVVSKANSTMGQIEERFSALENVGASLAKVGAGLTAAVTVPIVGIGTASIQAAGQMEQARIGFTTLLKSGEAAGQMLENLRQFALKTPFNFPDLVTASQRLMAMGFAAKEVIPTLESVGNATAALGQGPAVMDRIVLALGQMRNSAKLSAQDMKQLTEAGIQGWKYLSDATGISMGEIQEKAKDVLTGAQAADIVLKGMAQNFAGGMEAQSKSLLGMWSNVQDAIKFTLSDIGSTLLPTAKAAIDNFVLPTLEGLKSLAHWFAELPEPIKMGALALAGLAAAAGPVLLVIGGLGMALPAIAAGLTAIGALGGVITAFGGVVAGAMGTLYAFATTAVPAAISAIGMFIFTTLPAAVIALGRFSTTLLVDAVGSLTTFATSAIPAAVAAMSTFITVTIPAAIAAVITFATTAIPAAIAGLTTMATTSIPAAVAGFASLASGGIAAAAASISSMATAAIPMLIGALSTLGVAALAAGAAFVGWKIGEYALSHVPALQKLNAAIGDMLVSVPLLGKALEKLYGIQSITDSSTKILADSTEKLRQYLATKGVVIEQGSLSLDAYNKKLVDAAKSMGQAGDATALAKKAAEEHAAALKKANDELKLAQKVLAETKKLYAQGAATEQDVANALEKVRQAAAKAHPELTQTGISTAEAAKAHKAYIKEIRDGEPHYSKFTMREANRIIKVSELNALIRTAEADHEKLNEQIRKGEGPLEDLSHALDRVKFSVDNLTPDMKVFNTVIAAVGTEAAKSADSLQIAFENAGIKSTASLKQTADQLRVGYEQIKNSGIATKGEIEQAWRAMMQAEIEYRKNLGEDVGPLQAELAKYDNAHKNLSKNVLDTWDYIRRGINASIDEFGRNLSNLGRDLLSGEFSIAKMSDAFKQLGLDIAQTFLDVGAKAITDFIKNHIGALLDALGNVLSKIPGIGTALGTVFSGAGGALGGVAQTVGATPPFIGPTVGQASGTAGSAAGSGGSAASGVLNTALGWANLGVSVVSGIVSFFQGQRQENTLNAIEENTRYIKGFAYGLIVQALDNWPQINNIRDYLWTVGHDASVEIISGIQEANVRLGAITDVIGDIRAMSAVMKDYAIATYETMFADIAGMATGATQPEYSPAYRGGASFAAAAAGSGLTVTFDLRGATISDNATVDRLMRRVTDEIRRVTR